MSMLAICAVIFFADPTPLTIVVRRSPREVEVRATLPTDLARILPQGKVLAKQAEQILSLGLIQQNGEAEYAIFGKYHHREGTLVFVPRYGLSAGQRYRATLRHAGKVLATREYRVPKSRANAAVVTHIYPSAEVLPANVLKFYLHFSEPMRQTRDIFDKLHILDEKGRPVHDPWRRTQLWSADSKRLTLWIHPGRIKKGVNLREEFGPVLEPNRSYTLVLDGSLLNAEGVRLGKDFTKKFRTTAAQRVRPLPEKWKLEVPRASTREPLVVRFGFPLDRALLNRFLEVRDATGKAIVGRIEVADAERRWTFTPEPVWEKQMYRLHIDPRLEDLAGNTPQQLFDRDLEAPQPATPTLRRTFEPR